METAAELLSPSAVLPACSSVAASIAELLRPPERLPLSQWAEKNIRLSSEYAPEATELTLYNWQREIFDSFTDPHVEEVTIKSAVQMVKTLFIQCAFAYVVDQAPGPCLLVQPTDTDAKDFSKERLTPMIRDNPKLRNRITESASGRDGNTILNKEFPGGSLALVGAQSAGNFARRTIRYLFGDEQNKYPVSVGKAERKEGDPMYLAVQRTTNFRSRRKIVRTCSPTVPSGAISKSYALSDRRRPWVPCWSCGTLQVMRWAQVKWDDSLADELKPTTAAYECVNPDCAARWNDVQRWKACGQTEWRADRPFTGHAGFWISHLYSPWKKLSQIVKDFLDAKDDKVKLQSFINTNLAEEWEEPGETPDAEILYARREWYQFGLEAVVPLRGLFLTAAVDVQDSPPRLEVEIEAWGRGRENWSIDYQIIQCFAANHEPLPVTSRELWDKLDTEVLQRYYPHESGAQMPIMVMCVDTGNRPRPVYDFATRHSQLAYGPAGVRVHSPRTVVPIKGNDDQLKIISKVSNETAARKRQGIKIVLVGTHCVKEELFNTYRHVRPKADGSASPGCHHFPMYEMAFFDGLASELRVQHEDGGIEYVKKAGARNEPLDLQVYNRAAATLLGMDRFGEQHWRQFEKDLGITPMPVLQSAQLDPSELPAELQGLASDPGAAPVPVPTPAPASVTAASISKPVKLIAPLPQPRPNRGTRGGFSL